MATKNEKDEDENEHTHHEDHNEGDQSTQHGEEENTDLTGDDFTDLDELTTEEDFDLDDSMVLGDEEEINKEETEHLEAPEATDETDEPTETLVEDVSKTTPEEEIPYSPQKIDVSLIVEVGRIHISMEKLLKLEPGNLLDLNFHPENGVSLIINGKIIGKAELIRVGDSIGIRILELGK